MYRCNTQGVRGGRHGPRELDLGHAALRLQRGRAGNIIIIIIVTLLIMIVLEQ